MKQARMKRTCPPHPAGESETIPRPAEPNVERILAEIEKEPIPERLLTLAKELQDALAKRKKQKRS